MCRQNEVDCSFIKVLHYFNHGIQCDKTDNFVHGEAMKYSINYIDFMRGA